LAAVVGPDTMNLLTGDSAMSQQERPAFALGLLAITAHQDVTNLTDMTRS